MTLFEKLLERVNLLYPQILLEASNNFDPRREKRGLQAENDFALAMVRHGYFLKTADRKQEREYHFDFLVYDDLQRNHPAWANRPENSNTTYPHLVEVKQKDKIIGDNILVEFVAKDQYAGWLCSHANYIAFENGEGKKQKFIFIKMDNLRDYVNNLMKKYRIENFPLFEKGIDPQKKVGTSIFNAVQKNARIGKLEFVNNFREAIFPKVYYRKEIRNDIGQTRPDGSVITFVPLNDVLASRNTDLVFYTDVSEINPDFKSPVKPKPKYNNIIEELINVVNSVYGSDDEESKKYIIDKIKSNDVSSLIDDIKDDLKDNQIIDVDDINRLVHFYNQNPNHLIFK
jgi:hypothetical protein